MNHLTLSLHEKAKSLASDYLRTEGQLLLVLIEMRKQRVFAELNYTGIFDYCERALKLSRAQAYYLKTVAEKSEEVPEIKVAVAQGELTLSQARRIAPVITQANQQVWISKAKELSQKELEKEVTAINPKAHVQEKIRPIAKQLCEMKVAVDEKTEKNIQALQDILSQKLKRAATLGEVVAWMAEVTREKVDPVRRAERSISSGKTKSTKRAAPQGRSHIEATTQHQLNLRDERQCSHRGEDGLRCSQTRWLDRHHIVPVSRGGSNAIENLVLLCKAHHQHEHRSGVA